MVTIYKYPRAWGFTPWTSNGAVSLHPTRGPAVGPWGKCIQGSPACHHNASSEAQSFILVCPSGRVHCPLSLPPTSSLVTPLGMQHNAVNLSIAVSVSGTLKIDRSHTTDLVRFTHIYEIKMIRGDRLCICGSSLLEIRFNSQPQIIWEQALAWCLEPKGTRLRRRDYLLRQTWESLHWTSRHAQLVCSYSNDHFWLSLWLIWSTCKEHCFLVLSLCNDINLAGTLLVMHWKPE